jgi:hypothetical protein
MQQEKSNWPIKKKLVLSLTIFTISYIIFLFLWVKIQDHYGKVLVSMASHLTAKVIDVEFDTIKEQNDEVFEAQFYILRRGNIYTRSIRFDSNLFTYNAPLTFAIMAAFFVFIKRHVRSYTEVLIILFTIHFFYVFFYEAYRLSLSLDRNNLESASKFELFVWRYLWGFFHSMLIRFEPFLIGIYLYLRFSSSTYLQKHSLT